jgi:hypothetical protein
MKKLTILGFSCLAAFTTASYANTTNFEGMSISMGGSFSSDQSKLTNHYDYNNLYGAAADASAAGSYGLDTSPSLDFIPSVQGSYTKALTKNFYLGFVAGVDLSKTEDTPTSDSIVFPNPSSRSDAVDGFASSTKLESKNHLFVGLEPSYALTDNMLGYVRVAYHQMKTNVKSMASASTSNLTDPVFTDADTDVTFRGVGVGFGATYFISPAYFIKAGAEWIQYQSKDVAGGSLVSASDEITLTQTETVKPAYLNVGIQVGYKF